MSIKALLLKQYDLYPKMQIQDIVKLIYQNEFAGGHLIENEDDILRKLQEELCSLKHSCTDKRIPCDAFEDIGNNLCRLHLAALKYYDISLNTVNKLFISTANSIKEAFRALKKNWMCLDNAVRKDCFLIRWKSWKLICVPIRKKAIRQLVTVRYSGLLIHLRTVL